MTREEAIKVLSSYDVNGVWADVDGKPYNAEEQAEAFDMAIEALQTDIVRCDDCKYKGKVGDVLVCRIHEISTRADDYCSQGERSEE